jgi:acrylyl-CoA reductase (NADPH)
MADEFKGLVAERGDDGVRREVRTLKASDLGPGEVTVRVNWSGVNYKDGLATIPDGNVARVSPLVPGIDLAGTVVEGGGFKPGTSVLAHGYDLGVAHHGGFAEYARVPAEWVVPLPAGLTEREAMALGTAGFTAALSVQQLEQRGLTPDDGPVLVTGATGGVGSVAVGILSSRGYSVAASTGKADTADWLRKLGASEVLDRCETSAAGKPLERERWAAAVDCVGGSTLEYAIRTLRYGGAVAASGLTGGTRLSTTVFPFILRGVALLGVDSAQLPIEQRRELWSRLATDYRPRSLDAIATTEVTLETLTDALDSILAGANRGRTLIRL